MLYSNCKLLAQDGSFLSHVDEGRLHWYIKHGLATIEPSDANAIRLNFTPKNRSYRHDDEFYATPLVNRCVVCGTNEKLTRHHVIPQSFRRYFAEEFKSRASHDVLAVCRPCHDEYNLHEVELRREIAERYQADVWGLGPAKDSGIREVASAAKALLNHGERLPRKREDELLLIVIDYLDKWPEKEDLEEVARQWPPRGANGYLTLGELVVSRCNTEQLNELAKEWRRHFVETMKPKYLPAGWSTERPLGEST